MDHEAFVGVATESVANNIASWVQLLSIVDNALDGDAYMMVMAMVFLVLGAISAGMWVSVFCCRGCFFDIVDDASMDVTNDLTTMPQSLDAANDNNERGHVLQTKHKIFLSHSGAQKSFVADLCADLMRCDRHAFFDRSRRSLPIGDKFPNLIFDAIKQCEVGVVVLSEEFFIRSKWPMLELVAMVEESKKPNGKIQIILVFYNISRDKCCDPIIQAKWMTKYWKKWEKEDKKRIDLRKWKSTLEIFGSTTGLVMKDGMLDGELRAEIIEGICKKVLHETRWDDSHVKGKRRLCQEICKKVYNGLQSKDLKGGVQVMGMYGMGGIGKTTACKILCNNLSIEYNDKVCHAELGSLCEIKLLRKVLKAFSNLDVKFLNRISDVGEGHGYLKSHVVKERVFLALDNVSDDSKEQAKPYLEAHFGDGSVVLVTARSMDQLQYLGVHKNNCFTMPELELEEAKSLFQNYSRLKKNDIDEELLDRCMERCYFSKGLSSSFDDMHYHPLALKVLGCEVGDLARKYGMTRQVALLTRINTFNMSRQKEHPVFSILRSSFDSLLEVDQLLFLHITLFLPDYPTGIIRVRSICEPLEWLRMVHGEQDSDIELRLECLKRRSLLESFGEDVYDFRMHDLWREFAADEIKGGRFKDEHFLHKSEECRGRVDLRKFPMMRVVKVMDVKGEIALDVRGLQHLQSLEVVLEDWDTSLLKVKGLGTLENLTFLRCEGIASCVAELGWLTNLEVVELAGFKGDSLPDMSNLTNLRILNLVCSQSLQTIKLQNLTSLMRLHILYCTRLQSVDVSGCTSLTELWGLTGAVSMVEFNHVSSCPNLPSLHGLEEEEVTKLRKVDITGCSSVRELDALRHLGELEELRALHCERLAVLPPCRLPKLRVLDITGCSSLLELNGLRHLSELEELRAMHCERLAVLPSCRLPNLRVLEIEPSKVPGDIIIDEFGSEADLVVLEMPGKM